MRPVDKGADLGTFNPYNDAQQPLIDRLGEFCSYCERLQHCGIHVEHKLPKDKFPALKYKWINFLLACVNCNSSKGSARIELTDYLWPDSDNTFRAFTYESEGRIIPNKGFDNALERKIEDTWKLFGLNKHPDPTVEGFVKPSDKDRRWLHRKQEWEAAINNKSKLLNNDNNDIRDILVERATAKGMFSIWFTVFSDDNDMKRRLISAFSNTDNRSFDATYTPIARPGGQI